jgi:hypothetical protein
MVTTRNLLAFGLLAITSEPPRDILYGGVDEKHFYKFCIKFCLHINNYKHGDGAKLEVISDTCNVETPCILCSKPDRKWNRIKTKILGCSSV